MVDLEMFYKKIDKTIQKAKIKDSNPEVVFALKRVKEETDMATKKKKLRRSIK